MTTQRRPTNNSNRTRTKQVQDVAPVTISMPSQSALAEHEPKLPLERLGDLLRRVREERGDDIQQIADYLCIRRGFLVALENNRYDEFPADAYVIGFLRSYANYLGVDSKDAIDRYRNEMAGRRKRPTLQIPTPITEGRTPSTLLMVGAAIAAFLIYALWYAISSSDRATVTTPPALPSASAPASEAAINEAATNPIPVASVVMPPPADTTTTSPGITLSSPAPAPTNAASPPTTTTPPSAPPAEAVSPANPTSANAAAPKDSLLTIRAEQSAWVMVSDRSGHALFDHVMKPGETYSVPKTPGLSLTTGNGSGIVLTMDGVDLPRLSTGSSHVLRNIPLDKDHLRALPANPD